MRLYAAVRAQLLVAAAAAVIAAPVLAADPVRESWGKAGVSFDQYRADAVTCAREGYYRDVSKTEAARTYVEASRRIDTITETGAPDSGNQNADVFPSAGAAAGSTLDVSYDPAIARSVEQAQRIGRVVQAARPQEHMQQVAQLLRSTIEQCLGALGYTRFRLTAEQQRHLDHLRRGTAARRAYLFSLASDPAVLRDQGA